MNSKERMLIALDGGIPDRLPVTTHHLMQSFLDKYMDGASSDEFFHYFGLDPICWILPTCPDENAGEYYEPDQEIEGTSASHWIVNDNWRIRREPVPGRNYAASRYQFVTPKGGLSMLMESNEHTSWVVEHLIKEKKDIDLLGEFMTAPKCDVEAVNKAAKSYGQQGIIRSHVCGFDVFGQPGVWQDAACLFGIENLIIATFEDPDWVHEFLGILLQRKRTYINSLEGAAYDVIELGGGDASTTVISPDIFNEFIAPYDSQLISEAQRAGQRIVYHTCGGMMPILEDIAAMGPDAMETFTPVGMGADVDLAEAKRRIGSRVCMIGGLDQLHFFTGCTEKETRKEVRRCFEAAGEGGGFILCPSDHFFDAELPLIKAFADEARKCKY
jgi:uroporphyrinogen-III decarboxylase